MEIRRSVAPYQYTISWYRPLGGKLEAFYFAFGDNDVYLIVDVPDTTSGAALTLAVNASGMVKIISVMLMTPEEVDAACKKTVSYRAPGR